MRYLSLKGQKSGVSKATVEKMHVRMFAAAIGETDPIYFEFGAARAAGYPNIIAPLTFAAALEAYAPPPGGLGSLELPFEILLHASQRFTYSRPIFVGDMLLLQSIISNVYEKKGGALEFIESETIFTSEADGAVIVKTSQTAVLRHHQ